MKIPTPEIPWNSPNPEEFPSGSLSDKSCLPQPAACAPSGVLTYPGVTPPQKRHKDSSEPS